MGRKDYQYSLTRLTAGINQAAEVATMEECADSRNMWAPRGKLEQRPGYRGMYVASVGVTTAGQLGDDSTFTTAIIESPIGTFTNIVTVPVVLNSLSVSNRWYLMFTDSTLTISLGQAVGLLVGMDFTNSNNVRALLEYYNGTNWVPLNVSERTVVLDAGAVIDTDSGIVVPHLNTLSDTWLVFVWPNDAANVTVNGVTNKALRFTMEALNGTTALDASVSINSFARAEAISSSIQVLFAAQFTRAKRYLALVVIDATAGALYFPTQKAGTPKFYNMGEIAGAVTPTEVYFTDPPVQFYQPDEPATLAVVPAADEAFISYNRKVSIHKSVPYATANTTNYIATVETGDFAVGTNAPFNRDFIAQRSEFPAAKYISFFQNRLWYVTDTTVGWSAALPYHKVFPLLSEEPLLEDDNSPITGLSPLGENMIVFKNDSIWQMVFQEVNAFGLSVYKPIKRVSGIGCVSNSSIQEINGELIFLSERGLYAFDGVRARKITLAKGQDRLRDFFNALAPSRRKFAVSVDWKPFGCYLLAVSVDSSDENNVVLVWDYEHDSFWLWDNMPVKLWLADEGSEDEFTLYFMDKFGRIFELNNGETDHGTIITSYATTQRMGMDELRAKHLRVVEVTGSNTMQDVDISILPNDVATAPTRASATLDMMDIYEKEYGTAVYDTDNYTEDRRTQKRLMFFQTGDHFQVKLSHSVKGVPFALSQLRVGFELLGAR